MLVLNLSCGHGHGFEGWFASADDFESQRERGLIECPLCANAEIKRMPSAPRLNVSGQREPSPESQALQTQEAGQALQALRATLARSEDVGMRFAEEARRIHYGEAQARDIRGQATLNEALDLVEEGIQVLPLPVLPKENLQ